MESPLPFGPGSREMRVERIIGPDGKVYEIKTFKETRLGEDGIYNTIEEIDCPRDATPPDGCILKIIKVFFKCINAIIYE